MHEKPLNQLPVANCRKKKSLEPQIAKETCITAIRDIIIGSVTRGAIEKADAIANNALSLVFMFVIKV